MRIALVDDNQTDLDLLHRYLEEELKGDSVITEFSSGEAFLRSYSAGVYDLIILDIYMGELTGVSVAQTIRLTDKDAYLVFCTTSNDFASESYEVNACYYLHKPFNRQQFSSMLSRIDERRLEMSRALTLSNGEKILLREIIYADYMSHRATLHLRRGRTVTERISFSELEQKLCSYPFFFSPSKGIIVNFYEVLTRSEDVLVMSDDARIPISRRKYNETMNAYSAFRFEQIRKEVLQ